MGLTKPNQELARDLQGLAADFKSVSRGTDADR